MASPENWSKVEPEKEGIVMKWESNVWDTDIMIVEMMPLDSNTRTDDPPYGTEYKVKGNIVRPPGYNDDFVVAQRETNKEEARKEAVEWMREHPNPAPPETEGEREEEVYTLKIAENAITGKFKLYEGDQRDTEVDGTAVRVGQKSKRPIYEYLDDLDADVVLYDETGHAVFEGTEFEKREM